VIRELLRRGPAGLRVLVRGRVPARFFHGLAPRVEFLPADLEPGIAQPNGLDMDLEATARAQATWLADFAARTEEEARLLRSRGATAVLADLPAVAFAAARRAGIPAFGVANFSWDWILEPLAEAAPVLGEAARVHAETVATAERILRLPFGGGFRSAPRIEDVPLVVPGGPGDPITTRRRLGLLDEERPLVLLSFGGLGPGPLRVDEPGALEPYHLLGPGPAPRGLEERYTRLPAPGAAALPHSHVVRIADVLVGKTGYSTCAEALALGTRVLFAERPGFRESPVLAEALLRHGCARPLDRKALERGRLAGPLAELLARPVPPPGIPTDGARVVAERVLRALGIEPRGR